MMSNIGQPSAKAAIICIHGVGTNDLFWMNRDVVPNISAHDPTITFSPTTEVAWLNDSGRSNPEMTFPVAIRRGETKDSSFIDLYELCWSDLTRHRRGIFANFLTALKALYEAPLVICRSAFAEKSTLPSRMINHLIMIVNWLITGPITGFNIVGIATALALLASRAFGNQEVGDSNFIPPALMISMLVVIGVLGFFFGRWRSSREMALRNLGYFVSIFALIGATTVSALYFSQFHDLASQPIFLVSLAGVGAFGFWLVVNYSILFAILFLVALALWSIFRSELRTEFTRSAATVALCVAQTACFKIIISVIWIAIFEQTNWTATTANQCKPDFLQSCDYVLDVQKNLYGILTFNSTLFLYGVASLLIVMLVRTAKVMFFNKILKYKSFRLPRIVVPSITVAILIAGFLANIGLFYLRDVVPVDYYASWQSVLLPSDWVNATQWGMDTLINTTGALFVLTILTKPLRGPTLNAIHILHDIVDHQYETKRRELNSLGGYWIHPRRERISARLREILKYAASTQDYSKFIIVAHSQGSVIAFDYLRQESERHQDKQFTFISLGSPLGVIYKTYFADYERAFDAFSIRDWQNCKWFNLFRVDDPLGGPIDTRIENTPTNESIGLGGHMYYWREKSTVELILKSACEPGGRASFQTELRPSKV